MKLKPPKVAELIGLITDCESGSFDYYERKGFNYRTRHCLWDGQSVDGRKHAAAMGDKEPFPWEGASDAKVRIADTVINRNVNLLMKSLMSARLQCQPVESADAAPKAAATTLLKWLIYTRCLDDLYREGTLAANILNEHGLVVLGIFWEQQTRTEMQTVSWDALQELYAQSGDIKVGLLLNAIANPMEEEVAAELLEELIPDHGTVTAVRALREEGEYEYEATYVYENLPRVVALEPWEDIYFPASTDNLQKQPHVHFRELIGEAELRSRVLTDDYDKAWVEKTCEVGPGKRLRETNSWWRDTKYYTDPDDKRIEIWHVYRKETTDIGSTRVTATVVHPDVPDRRGKHSLIPFDHGAYPFVEIARERTTRRLIDSRGVPEIIASNQDAMKIQRDFRSDRAALAISPPLRVPANRGKLACFVGPRAELPERRQGEISWMQPPALDPGSDRDEAENRRDVNEYFGRMGEGIDPTEAMLVQEQMVLGWLIGWKLIFTQVFQLAQQFLTDDEVARVTGTLPAPFHVDRATIQGQFDITVEFDPRDLDNERLGAKLDYIAKVLLPMDSAGVIDRAGMVQYAFAAVDPRMAEMFVRPAAAAAASEAADERQQLSNLWSGVEPPLAEEGQNAQLRLQIIQQQLSANPQWQQRYSVDELFRRMLDARIESFGFQITQQRNALIGRQGAAPVLGPQNQLAPAA